MGYFETTPMGRGYAGHERRESNAPRAADVMAARFAGASLLAPVLAAEAIIHEAAEGAFEMQTAEVEQIEQAAEEL